VGSGSRDIPFSTLKATMDELLDEASHNFTAGVKLLDVQGRFKAPRACVRPLLAVKPNPRPSTPALVWAAAHNSVLRRLVSKTDLFSASSAILILTERSTSEVLGMWACCLKFKFSFYMGQVEYVDDSSRDFIKLKEPWDRILSIQVLEQYYDPCMGGSNVDISFKPLKWSLGDYASFMLEYPVVEWEDDEDIEPTLASLTMTLDASTPKHNARLALGGGLDELPMLEDIYRDGLHDVDEADGVIGTSLEKDIKFAMDRDVRRSLHALSKRAGRSDDKNLQLDLDLDIEEKAHCKPQAWRLGPNLLLYDCLLHALYVWYMFVI
jgi:hypothetical protein